VNFVDDPAAADLVVSVEHRFDPMTGDALGTNQTRWITADGSPTMAGHELGHQMNLIDEYADLARAPNRAVHTDNSLMGHFVNEPGPTELKPRAVTRIGGDIQQSGHLPITMPGTPIASLAPAGAAAEIRTGTEAIDAAAVEAKTGGLVPPAPSQAATAEVEAALERKSELAAEIERANGGRRRPGGELLDAAEIERLKQEFVELGGDPEVLKFNVGSRTGFIDDANEIVVRGDVNPIESTNPRSSMSSRSVLAHELGHAHYRGTPLPINAWNDEFRASYWAAKNLPSLSEAERAALIADAQLRAAEAGVTIRLNSLMKKLLYGIE
jgi:hypothetical protein